MRIGKKTIHDVTIGLAMALPILYLGGSMIAGLCGAHGEKVFKDDTPSYEYLMKEENFSYDAFDWNNDDYGKRIGFSLGSAEAITYFGGYYFEITDYGVRLHVNDTADPFGPVVNNGLGYSSELPFVSVELEDGGIQVGSDVTYQLEDNGKRYALFYILPNEEENYPNENKPATLIFTSISKQDGTGNIITPTSIYQWDEENWSLQPSNDLDWYGWGGSTWYFDDGSHLFGFDKLPDNIKKAFRPVVKAGYSLTSYSDEIFGNFFPKNNFVERIGQNALSDNPKGFAPFGTMLNYLDSNMFHAGDSQTCLMVYGMVYWSLHVIIADLVYHVLVFVPNLINKVFDWFGQRGLNDD